MRFVPNYCVSYHGEFHNAGCAFEIDSEDAEEMSRHGTVELDRTHSMESVEPEPRRGRPRKMDTG